MNTSSISNSYIIVESEIYTAKAIVRHMKQVLPSFSLTAFIEDVKGIKEFSCFNDADLILSEVNLPDGESIKTFTEMNINTPLLFFSDYEQSRYDLSGLNVVGFLLKPVVGEEIKDALASFNPQIINSHCPSPANGFNR